MKYVHGHIYSNSVSRVPNMDLRHHRNAISQTFYKEKKKVITIDT